MGDKNAFDSLNPEPSDHFIVDGGKRMYSLDKSCYESDGTVILYEYMMTTAHDIMTASLIKEYKVVVDPKHIKIENLIEGLLEDKELIWDR